MTKSKGIGRGNNPNSRKGMKNLIPTTERPPEEAKEILRKGNKAAVRVIKQKKEAKNVLNTFTSVDMKDSTLIPNAIKNYCDSHNIVCTARNAMDVAMILGSLYGTKDGVPNPACYKAFMDYNIGPPVQRTEVQMIDDNKVNDIKKKLRDHPALITELFGNDEDE